MISYLACQQMHSASAMATMLLAVTVPAAGWRWQRRAPSYLRKVLILDRAATIAMLATVLTGIVLASWGGWWPLAWIRISVGMVSVAFVVDLAMLFPGSRLPSGLRWGFRAAVLLVALALMVLKPT